MELLKVQEKALEKGYGRDGFAYFLEMGLGKTLLALTEFHRLVQSDHATRLVVTCPNSFKAGWVDEINKHGFDFDANIFSAGNNQWNDTWLAKDYDKPPVLIVNYEAIRSEGVQRYISEFTRGKKCMLVVDESIQIKTHNSLQTKAVLFFAPYFTYKRILSGKPVTEGPHDLWAQLRAIGVIRDNYFPFKTTFCRMGGFRGKRVIGSQNEEILAAKIDKYIFRATKADWTDLPPKSYTSRQYALTATMYEQYRSMEEDFVLWLKGGEYVTVDTFITKYIKLAQIQSGFIIQEDGRIAELVSPQSNPRFNLVRDIMQEVPGKCVVTYVHRYTRMMLAEALEKYNPAFIAGGMDPDEITMEKDRFANNRACRVMLVQIRAGKYGHTLLGDVNTPLDRCSTMIFAENSYSLDDRSQIEDRIHRHGQTQNCLYVDLWGTELDHRITQALQRKEDVVQATFSHFR